MLSLGETMRFPCCRAVAGCAVNRAIRSLVCDNTLAQRAGRGAENQDLLDGMAFHSLEATTKLQIFAGGGAVSTDKRRQRNMM